jgi:hypothetical protein
MQISSLNLAAFSFVFQTKCLSGSRAYSAAIVHSAVTQLNLLKPFLMENGTT